VTETVDFFERHGYWVLFVWILVDQLGVPIPAIPLLIGAGALAGAGKISPVAILVVAVSASLLADMLWFSAGRRRGHHILSRMCALTLEPDSCVRRAETAFATRGVRGILVAKFLPGLNAIVAALAGILGIHAARFVGYASTGGVLWAGSWLGLGYFFSAAIVDVVSWASRLGLSVVGLLAVAVGGYVAFKYVQRQRFLRSIRIRRIPPDELKKRLDAGEEVLVLDLRSAIDVAAMPYTIPGATRVPAEDLEQRHQDLPRDRDIVLFCT
jgi:membrane protein DedA with SNARE-associated domain